MRFEYVQGVKIPNFEPTEYGFGEFEKLYKTGDIVACRNKDFFDVVGNAIQIAGWKLFPEGERYAHLEPITDDVDGTTLKADGREVRRANVDNYRGKVFDGKLRLVIYRAMPEKTEDELATMYLPKGQELLYKKYDTAMLVGMVKNNFINFWNWLTGKPDAQNKEGDRTKPVCSTVCFLMDEAVKKYDICPSVDLENIYPTLLVHDKTYAPICSIG